MHTLNRKEKGLGCCWCNVTVFLHFHACELLLVYSLNSKTEDNQLVPLASCLPSNTSQLIAWPYEDTSTNWVSHNWHNNDITKSKTKVSSEQNGSHLL